MEVHPYGNGLFSSCDSSITVEDSDSCIEVVEQQAFGYFVGFGWGIGLLF